MSASLRDLFEAAADERALLRNSRASYWAWLGVFFRAIRRPAGEWTGGDWERFERWLIGERYSYAARRQARSHLAARSFRGSDFFTPAQRARGSAPPK